MHAGQLRLMAVFMLQSHLSSTFLKDVAGMSRMNHDKFIKE